MDDAVVRRGEDDDIGGIVIQALCERLDMVRLNHLNGISVANLLARHLAAEVVELLERVANTAVEFADFAERRGERIASSLVLHGDESGTLEDFLGDGG